MIGSSVPASSQPAMRMEDVSATSQKGLSDLQDVVFHEGEEEQSPAVPHSNNPDSARSSSLQPTQVVSAHVPQVGVVPIQQPAPHSAVSVARADVRYPTQRVEELKTVLIRSGNENMNRHWYDYVIPKGNCAEKSGKAVGYGITVGAIEVSLFVVNPLSVVGGVFTMIGGIVVGSALVAFSELQRCQRIRNTIDGAGNELLQTLRPLAIQGNRQAIADLYSCLNFNVNVAKIMKVYIAACNAGHHEEVIPFLRKLQESVDLPQCIYKTYLKSIATDLLERLQRNAAAVARPNALANVAEQLQQNAASIARLDAVV